MSVGAVEATISHSRWTPGQPGIERGKARRYVRLAAKVASCSGEWRKIELTFARFNVPQFTRRASWVKADGSARNGERWFHLARDKRLVGEFKKRLERHLGTKLEYFKAAEFQRDGWLHYHVLMRVTGRHGRASMIGKGILERLWGWGFVWERPVDAKAVAYAAKGVAYASKGIGDVLPEYMHKLSSLTKLTSTSRGFYLDGVDRKRRKSEEFRHREVSTIGALVANPRIGVRTKLRVVDGETGLERVREVKGGDMYILTCILRRLGAKVFEYGAFCSPVYVGVGQGEDGSGLRDWGHGGAAARVTASGWESAPASGASGGPSLVTSLHCGVDRLIECVAAELAELAAGISVGVAVDRWVEGSTDRES